MSSTSIQDYQAAGNHPHCLIDVRSPGEFAALHAEGAQNLPLDAVDSDHVSKLAQARSAQTVYLLCQSGNRARMAAEKLSDLPDTLKVVVIEGGTNAWMDADLPIIQGKGMISIERQVRIGAGSLVLLGVILGFQFDAGFLGISAFVGAGLIFAGITDWCGMGLLLAKMPWNTKAPCSEGTWSNPNTKTSKQSS